MRLDTCEITHIVQGKCVNCGRSIGLHMAENCMLLEVIGDDNNRWHEGVACLECYRGDKHGAELAFLESAISSLQEKGHQLLDAADLCYEKSARIEGFIEERAAANGMVGQTGGR